MICNFERFSVNGFEISPINLVLQDEDFNGKLKRSDSFCIFVAKIDTKIEIESRKYKIPANSIVFIGIGSEVFFRSDSATEKNGYLLTFKSSFYEDSPKKDLFLKSNLFYPKKGDATIIHSKDGVEYVENFMLNRLKLFLKNQKYSMFVAAAQSCTEFLILEGLSKTIAVSGNHESEDELVHYDLTNKFLVLLDKNYKERRDVAFYAQLLDVPAWKLSKITEMIVQKQAKQIIVEKIVYEAESLLRSSKIPIAEVARILGFTDSGNFTTFVKKHAKRNPSEFRKRKVLI